MIRLLNRDLDNPLVEVDGRKLPLAIKRHRTAKRLVLRLAPDGSEVRVTIPRWGQTRDALEFAQSRRAWIAAQLAKVVEPRRLAQGSTLPVRGTDYTIRWDRSAARKPTIVEETIVLGGPEAGLSARIERWLRTEALRLLEDDLRHYCERAGVDAPSIALSRAQRRWGSCSTSGTVRINWRLVMAPDSVRRSVVAHEVAHLVHFDHSPAFHRLLVEIFGPELADADAWLKRHGRSLYAPFG